VFVLNVLVTLTIGVLTAYIGACLLLAQKQLIAATRLQSYLMHWQNWILENDMFSVFNHGKEWNKEIKVIQERGGTIEEIVELGNQKKDLFLNQLKAHIEKEGMPFDRSLLVSEIGKMPRESLNSILDFCKTARQNLIEGKTYITDEEASTLGLAMASKAIEVKMGILDLIDGTALLAAYIVGKPEEFDVKDHAQQIARMFWKGVEVSRHLDKLFEFVQVFTRRSVLKLTWMNIKNGSRLSLRK
jgi:hypothetical protein